MKIKGNYTVVYIACMMLALLSLGSCKKYLDKKSDNTLIVPSSLADLQALMDGSTIMNQNRTPCLGEISTDEYFMPLVSFNALSDASKKYYTWRNYSLPNSASDWSSCYEPVYYANLVLDRLKDISKNDNNSTEWNNVKGSALFYRSYYFLELLWNYAKAYDSTTAGKDLGIALRLSSDFNIKSTRSTNEQGYRQVIKDTKASIALLPNYAEHVFRPSKVAAYGLLARCYLSMRDYPDALLYSDSCLGLNSQLMDLNGDADIAAGLTASYPFQKFNKETIFYTEMGTLYTALYNTGLKARIDTVLYQSYDENDLRRTGFFKQNADGYMQFKGSYAKALICFSGIATDEMYLTRAECYVRTGLVQKGLNDLNALLVKRYKSGTFVPYANSLSQTAALKLVLGEREKELIMRGLRWMDLKRLNKEGANILLKRVEGDSAYTLLPNANFYALPLPEDIIQMTGMPQNPM